MATIGEALASAFKHHQAGRLEEAVALYRRILAARPEHADANHLLGVVAYQRGDHGRAIQLIEKALALNPNAAAYHKNLGSAYQALGDLDKAVAHHETAIRLKPDYHEAQHGLAEALRRQGRHEGAIASYREATEIAPDFIHAHNGLAISLVALGRHEEAEPVYRKALALNPEFAEAHINLANLLKLRGKRKDAESHFRAALALQPRSIAALVNLGNLYKDMGRVGEAVASYEKALEIRPDFAPAHNNLANLFKDQGESAQAVAHFRKAIEFDPALVDAHSNLLLSLHYSADYTPEAIFETHREWARRHAEPLTAQAAPHDNAPEPERRLRLGYVSPDLRRHPVASFLEPVLAHQDRAGFELFCYANVERPDKVTERLRAMAGNWRDLRGLPDAEVARMVRADRIDILVDLAGHTAYSRMGVFARKPAPVQAGWLGYPNTTGLGAVDFRITDDFADPPGATDRLHTERLVRLPHGFHCFRPAAEAPAVGPQPADGAGHVTFASFNMLSKVGPVVIARWSEILLALPDARLVLKAPPLADAGARERLASLFARHGVAAERLEMHGYIPSPAGHLALYNKVDIALDTFPYNGVTTTCEALWMGVPVVTEAGNTHVSRVGVSLLSNLGLAELIAEGPAGYVALALDLARDRARLAQLRESLRARMESAPLTDGPGFTRALESAYREMWRDWCGRAPTQPATRTAST